MPLKKLKPTTPGRRFATWADNAEVTKKEPEKSLVEGLKKSGGRNSKGRITSRHRGGGAKRRYRKIDFKRRKDDVPATVASIEYDPNRSAHIALLHYADGDKRYILAPARLRVGATVVSGEKADITPGNTLPLRAIPTGTTVHNVEMTPGRGGQMGRSAGTAIQLVAKEGTYATLRLPSGEMRMVHTFLEESQILDEQVATPEALLELLGRDDPDGEPYTTELLASDDGLIRVRAVERKSNLARTHRLRRSMFEANEYRQLARVHAELVKMAGTPPFSVKLGEEADDALSFEDLRRTVMEVAAKGIKLQRFKGLGEMNADQLRETTMDPTTRTLMKVTMDDAAVADRLFTMLMGDKVEPRREFIEENARVATLDI